MATNLETLLPQGYTLVRPINEGACGRVLEVKHSATGKSYALKLMPRLSEADSKRGEREASLLERFRHPRIVGLHESIVINGYHGIVMELGKRNLKDLMLDYESRNESIPLEVAVQICIDIAEGLCVMHTHPSHPMAHGDLKPENVLLMEDNRAMLCDLGAADASGINTSHSAKEIGTFEYNSPERVKDPNQRGTPASDIWSLGVILYRMVTRWPLFDERSLPKIIRAIEDFDESNISKTLHPDFRGVLLRLLDHNPDSRATSTQLFKGRLLERMLGSESPLSKVRLNQIQSLEKQLTQHTEAEKSLQETKRKYDNLVESLRMEQVANLPPLIIRPPRCYQIRDQTFTRIKLEDEKKEEDGTMRLMGVVTLSEPITCGIVSISVTLTSLPILNDDTAFDIHITPASRSLSPLHAFETFDSFIRLSSFDGLLLLRSPSTEGMELHYECHEPLIVPPQTRQKYINPFLFT
ncbi:putative Cyclin-dependent kinase 2 [Blattamonas nauphoetae]|uniref:non-specific serine/threonine protein kinase n=1 Tax=Blattamonas nauphoetae TaxID=2049346 RepID=A0ABQ9X1X4_9EUKA|nr:putative Cyclin-dependent kinase 2 [Blattamonas nauphoetae]